VFPLSDSDSDEGTSDDEDLVQHQIFNKFITPKLKPYGPWNNANLKISGKTGPHLRNFADSVLRHASLSELTGMARQKISGSKVLSQIMSANYDLISQFPVKVEAGEVDCIGLAHLARFLRGYVGDSQAIKKIGSNSLDPIGNYKVVSIGIGDLIPPRARGKSTNQIPGICPV
jgi:hypothetical protein